MLYHLGREDEKGDGTTHVLDESTRLAMKWQIKKGDRFITKQPWPFVRRLHAV
jgi:hypothetical protein